ncbi:MAG TPA: flagellar protein FliT [Pseudomonas sp.]|nr:flagellar protein FliT [Pseudomonas sp.]
MQAIIQSIVALRVSLQEALSRQDWEAIGELDRRCRVLVAEVVASEAWDDQALREQVEELTRLYEQLLQSGRAERERLAGELTRLNQSKQVTNTYKPLV